MDEIEARLALFEALRRPENKKQSCIKNRLAKQVEKKEHTIKIIRKSGKKSVYDAADVDQLPPGVIAHLQDACQTFCKLPPQPQVLVQPLLAC